jgi:DNA-directed RNA polymerase subunit RPC12/RpoP
LKILKYGEGYPKTVTCDRCKSELEYDINDIHTHNSTYFDHIESAKTVKCPVCSHHIIVDASVHWFIEPEKKKKWWQI